MNEIAKRQTTDLSTETKNPFLAHGEQATQRNIVGELLKFSKGDWLVGQDNEEVQDGTQYVANMDEMLLGWIRWSDNKPTDHVMGKVSQGYQVLARRELGDTDEHDWEVDDRGDPRDPWQLSYYLLLKGMVDGELYTFATGSNGGRKGCGILCVDYGKVLAQHPDEYPVVALAQTSYEHPVKAYGRIKEPRFNVIGWVGKETFKNDLGEIDHADEDPVLEPTPAATPLPKRPSPITTKKPAGRI